MSTARQTASAADESYGRQTSDPDRGTRREHDTDRIHPGVS